jgi:hypothetical protein
MSAHLHLPALAVEATKNALHHFRKPKPAHTDPAVIARWAEWLTPDQWMAEHGHEENER